MYNTIKDFNVCAQSLNEYGQYSNFKWVGPYTSSVQTKANSLKKTQVLTAQTDFI